MAENLDFSKIVSTPTPSAWSQAYSAGKLFAAFSLEVETVPDQGLEYLAGIGKDVISTLEAEFFTLEDKSLESIRGAVVTSLSRVGSEIKSSLILCYFAENVLYLFAQGGGKAAIKRGEKIGTVLESEISGSDIKTSSGYVKDQDILVLETKPFQDIISQSSLASALDKNKPEEIAEEISPQVHERAEGGAAAVIVSFIEGADTSEAVAPLTDEEASEEKPDETLSEEIGEANPEVLSPQETESEESITLENLGSEAPVEEVRQEIPPSEDIPTLGRSEINTPPFAATEIPSARRGFSLPFGSIKLPSLGRIPRQRRTAAIVAGVLILLIVVVAALAIFNKNGGANDKLFQQVYSQAKQKYDEGQNLKDLNSELAQSDFKDAKNTIEQNQSKFPADSKDGKQLSDLLAQINSQLKTTGGQTATAKEVASSQSKLLSVELDNSSASYFTQNDQFVYFLDGSGAQQIDKGNDKKTQILKKSWKTDGGVGTFGSNVYVLDRSDGIHKLVPASDGTYADNDYFSSNTPDLSNSVDMAIDGSVYVLNKDGSIDKYTKGASDTFSASSLDTPLKGATRIYTNSDFDNIYVLDNGNSRIVVLDKTGKFVTSYSAVQVKAAKDLDVDETGKKIFILSSGKVYQIDIK